MSYPPMLKIYVSFYTDTRQDRQGAGDIYTLGGGGVAQWPPSPMSYPPMLKIYVSFYTDARQDMQGAADLPWQWVAQFFFYNVDTGQVRQGWSRCTMTVRGGGGVTLSPPISYPYAQDWYFPPSFYVDTGQDRQGAADLPWQWGAQWLSLPFVLCPYAQDCFFFLM